MILTHHYTELSPVFARMQARDTITIHRNHHNWAITLDGRLTICGTTSHIYALHKAISDAFEAIPGTENT